MTKHTHMQWYLKLDLTEDISIRYFFIFENRPELQGKWVIKSHSKKEYGIIDKKSVELIAKSHNKDIDKDSVEVIARALTNTKYRRIVLDNINPNKIDVAVEKDFKDNEYKIFYVCEDEKDVNIVQPEMKHLFNRFMNIC